MSGALIDSLFSVVVDDLLQLLDIYMFLNWRNYALGEGCRKGGQLLWIAPSGGRDRPDPITTEWVPVRLST